MSGEKISNWVYNYSMHVYTIGYGNRAIGDFLALLRLYQVECLADSRSLPTSRFRPDYRQKALAAHLEQAGLEYWYVGEALGGKRVDPECMVDGKIDLERLAGLPAFREAVDRVAERAAQAQQRGQALALMCAELRPEVCHRAWMLAPQMEARGFEVLHIDAHGALKTQPEVQGWFTDA
jgi:ATP-dependent DNA helicase RecQ